MSLLRRCGVAATTLSTLLFAAGHSAAQQAIPAGGAKTSVIQLDVNVSTSKGKPAGLLNASNFTVLDNKGARPIASFARMEGKDLPVEVVIVVDSVNTPYVYLAYQRDQIAKYLRGNDGMLPYPTTFAVLTDTSFNVYAKPTKAGGALADALDNTDIGLREINRAQGFYGASDRLTISVNALSQLLQAESTKPGRKLIVWVSPGWPLLSGPEVELDSKQQEDIYHSVIAFSTGMRKADVTLYSVNSWGAAESVGREFYFESFLDGLKNPGDAQLGNLALQTLATQSGGLVLNSSDVIGMMTQCVADADQFYRLTLEPAPGDKPNEYHKLQVKVDASGLVARTTLGYYAQQ